MGLAAFFISCIALGKNDARPTEKERGEKWAGNSVNEVVVCTSRDSGKGIPANKEKAENMLNSYLERNQGH